VRGSSCIRIRAGRRARSHGSKPAEPDARKPSTLAGARRTREWATLVTQMRALLRNMPLWRLQRVGHEDVRFLYEAGPGRNSITLLPGVACHLRERAPLIRRLAETEWLRFVLSLKQNAPVLAPASAREIPRMGRLLLRTARHRPLAGRGVHLVAGHAIALVVRHELVLGAGEVHRVHQQPERRCFLRA